MNLLSDLDHFMLRHVRHYASLDPGRDVPRPFAELGQHDLFQKRTVSEQRELLSVLEQIVLAQLLNFPDNIYWDFDYFFHVLLMQPDKASLRRLCALICDLMERYGAHSEIRFEFIHDFSFGFDWARWVRKKPEARSHILPYDFTFLDYLKRRHRELCRLIEENDATYSPLKPGQWRNPFRFSRSFDDEIYTLETLAGRQLIPVPGWCSCPVLNWRPDYTMIREKLMKERRQAE